MAETAVGRQPCRLAYRSLLKQDMPALLVLHKEFFPITYEEGYYEAMKSGDLITFVCVRLPDGEISEETVVGFIVMSTLDDPKKDIPMPDDENLLSFSFSKRYPAYVMTLGVVPEHRSRGIASRLLEMGTAVVQGQQECKAVYLHVLSSNTPAINFYRKHGYKLLRRLSQCYIINGRYREGLLLIRYINGGSMPFSTRLLHAIGGAVKAVWGSVGGYLPAASEDSRHKHENSTWVDAATSGGNEEPPA